MIVTFFNKWRRLLNPLDLIKLNGIASIWTLTGTLELMPPEPVLLEAPLSAILHDFVALAFGAAEVWQPLLVKFPILARASSILIIFPQDF